MPRGQDITGPEDLLELFAHLGADAFFTPVVSHLCHEPARGLEHREGGLLAS